MRKIIYLILFTLTACGYGKVKVVVDTYDNGKPKTIRYFNSAAASKDTFTIIHKNGKGRATKSVNFDVEGYYENGKLQYKGQYINGKTSGLWEYFYETGILQAKSYYDINSKSTDTVHCWYESGNKKRDIVELDKVKKLWRNVDYFENGNKYVECYQTKDSSDRFKLNGSYKEWYDNGQLKFIATFKDGWTIGKWQEYELNGKLKEESEKPFSITIE